MLGLDEKERTIVIIKGIGPRDASATDEILEHLQSRKLIIKQRKTVQWNSAEADAWLIANLSAERRTELVKEFSTGSFEVIAVDHVNGKAWSVASELVTELENLQRFLYTSQSRWEALYDVNYFFPIVTGHPVERTLALIKPEVVQKQLESLIIGMIQKEGLIIVDKRTLIPSQELATSLYGNQSDQSHYDELVASITKEPGVVALCLEGKQAIERWKLLCGPDDSEQARQIAPNSIRALFGTDVLQNAVHASDSHTIADHEISLFCPIIQTRVSRTLFLIKTEALEHEEDICSFLEDREFHILKKRRIQLTEERARLLFQNQSDLPDHAKMCRQVSSGPVIAMIISRLASVEVANQVAGPQNPKKARISVPWTLRAQYGIDDIKNAVYTSSNKEDAERELCILFSAQGVDPLNSNIELVKDYLFRKSVISSMDVRRCTEPNSEGYIQFEKTFQQFLMEGFVELCKIQPKGMEAVEWLADWLLEHNPNKQKNDDKGLGMKPKTEPPQPPIIDVDVSKEADNVVVNHFRIPPVIILVLGGPGSGKGTQCELICEKFNFKHLSTGDLLRAEVKAKSAIGVKCQKIMQNGELVPASITVNLLLNAMKESTGNRFLLDGFPRSLEQTQMLETELAEASFAMFFDCPDEVIIQRLLDRGKTSGRADDNADSIKTRLATFHEETKQVVDHYLPTGRAREISVDRPVEEVYQIVKRLVDTHFMYLVGPSVIPLADVGKKICEKYGYVMVNAFELYNDFIKKNSKTEDSEKLEKALKNGDVAEASIVCPIILEFIQENLRRKGQTTFLFVNFPQSVKQMHFIQHKIESRATAVVFDLPSKADGVDIGLSFGYNLPDAEKSVRAFHHLVENTDFLQGCQDVHRVTISQYRQQSTPAFTKEQQQDEIINTLTAETARKLRSTVTVINSLPKNKLTIEFARKWAERCNSFVLDVQALIKHHITMKSPIGLLMAQEYNAQKPISPKYLIKILKDTLLLAPTNHMVIFNYPNDSAALIGLEEEFIVDNAFCLNFHAEDNENMHIAFCAEFDDAENMKKWTHLSKLHKTGTSHYAMGGKARIIDVGLKSTVEAVMAQAERHLLPEFISVHGLPGANILEKAETIPGHIVTLETLIEFGKNFCGAEGEGEGTSEDLAKFMDMYRCRNSHHRYVMVDYPRHADDANAFVEVCGPPRNAFYIDVSNQILCDRATEAAEAAGEEGFDPEAYEASLNEKIEVFDALQEVWSDYYIKVEDSTDALAKSLLPALYILVAPTGKGFRQNVLEAISTSFSTRVAVLDTSTVPIDKDRYSTNMRDEIGFVEHKRRHTTKGNMRFREKLFRETFTNLGTNSVLLTNVDQTGVLTQAQQLDVLNRAAQIKGVLICSFEMTEEEKDSGMFSSEIAKLTDSHPQDLELNVQIGSKLKELLPPEKICEWSALPVETEERPGREWVNYEEAEQNLLKTFFTHFGLKRQVKRGAVPAPPKSNRR